MKKGKKLALIEAIVAIFTLLIILATFVVFVAYDVNMISDFTPPEGDAAEQFGASLGEGIGRLFLIVFIIIGFFALIPSVIMSIVSAIGQFIMGVGKRGVPTLGFVIVGMIGKIFAAIILVPITSMILGLGFDGPVVAIIHISLTALMFVSLIWSVVVLVLRKKIIVAEQNAAVLVSEGAEIAETAETMEATPVMDAEAVKTAEEIAPAAEYPNEE